MTVVLLLLFLSSPQVTTGNFLFTSVLPPKMVPLSVRIDFGPAEKPLLEKEVMIPEGSTPKQALKRIVSIAEGSICCDPAEVKGIEGVLADPTANRWWRLKINGTTKHANPHKSHLKSGDRMEWIYFEEGQ